MSLVFNDTLGLLHTNSGFTGTAPGSHDTIGLLHTNSGFTGTAPGSHEYFNVYKKRFSNVVQSCTPFQMTLSDLRSTPFINDNRRLELYSYYSNYQQCRSQMITTFTTHSLITTPSKYIELLYDVFYANSITEELNEASFWHAVDIMGYPFAQWRTPFHTILFEKACSNKKGYINLFEAILLVIILRDDAPRLLSFGQFMVDFDLHCDSLDLTHAFTHFPAHTLFSVTVYEKVVDITRKELCYFYQQKEWKLFHVMLRW